MNFPKGQLIASGILLAFYTGIRVLYAPFDNLIRAQLGVGQLSNDTILTGLSLYFSQHSLLAIVGWAAVILLLIIWLPWLFRNIPKFGKNVMMLMVVASLALGGCIPYRGTKVVEIQPNQTAFLLPAQGATSEQAKFDSVEYLQNQQVAAKIIEITYRQHKVGRMYWSVDFIPTNILILVNRAPVSRQWTFSKETGSVATNQAIGLESQESIGFHHGVVVNAVITEEDAAKFLYYYGGVGVAADAEVTGVQLSVGLEQVMDEFVRTWVADELYAEFKARNLEQGQQEAANIFNDVETRAIENFKKYGITILNLGGIDGLIYDNPAVQEAIDNKFQAAAQATAQAITNDKNVQQADADAQVTVKAAEAEAEALQLTGEQLVKYPSIVNKILAEKSVGDVPEVLVINNTSDGTATAPFPFWFFYPPK